MDQAVSVLSFGCRSGSTEWVSQRFLRTSSKQSVDGKRSVRIDAVCCAPRRSGPMASSSFAAFRCRHDARSGAGRAGAAACLSLGARPLTRRCPSLLPRTFVGTRLGQRAGAGRGGPGQGGGSRGGSAQRRPHGVITFAPIRLSAGMAIIGPPGRESDDVCACGGCSGRAPDGRPRTGVPGRA